jgi:NAD+ synthase/NAD+ synthase (glutamine-hydrolysing)
MRIALVQMDARVGDLAANAAAVRLWAGRAAAAGADLAVFPELALCGYPPMDLAHEAWFVRANLEALHELAEGLPVPVLVGHLGDHGRGRPIAHNAASLLAEGRVIATRNKRLLPTYDVFDEWRLFAPDQGSEPIPFGGRMLGISICEDIWGGVEAGETQRYDEDPCAELVRRGAEVLINLSASPFSRGHRGRRHLVLQQAARRYGRPVLQSNMVGATDELIFDGASLAVDPSGRVMACAPSFVEAMEVVDLDRPSDAACAPESDEELEVIEALSLGLRAYCRKCGFDDVLLGLSGGIDSALVACIAARALGPAHVRALSMPTRYSSEGSWADSRELAHRLGIGFEVLSIDDLYRVELDLMEGLVGDLGHSVTAQNLQARSRGLVLMALSNAEGGLLLATGNKSELGVGYSTLYGDMCGGLAPIGDVYKTQVYALTRAFNRVRPDTVPQSILDKAPSAELAPDQRDTDSLPPYAVLDAVLAALIEEGAGPAEIAERGSAKPEVVHRVASLLARAEHKRHQYAPILRVSKRVFGRGRRMCIAARPYG